MKAEIPRNNLGGYLTKLNIDSVVVSEKTSIPVSDIRKMRSGEIKSIPAHRAYLMASGLGLNISTFLQGIFPDLQLDKNIDNNPRIPNNNSELGNLIVSLQENSLEMLASKTGIKITRLKRMMKLDKTRIDAHELYLIELASQKPAGTLFKILFQE